jgi:hypothetical protein
MHVMQLEILHCTCSVGLRQLRENRKHKLAVQNLVPFLPNVPFLGGGNKMFRL